MFGEINISESEPYSINVSDLSQRLYVSALKTNTEEGSCKPSS